MSRHTTSRRGALLNALSGLRAHRLRSALTMFSLIIGVSAVILLVACGYGVKNSIDARVETMANDIAIVPTTAGIPGGPPVRNLTDADASVLQDAPDVATVTPSINSSGMTIATGTVKLLSGTIIGTTDIWAATHNRVLTAGSFFDQTQARQAARVAVVGPTVATTLFGDPAAALGQTIQINHAPFRVIGVMQSYGQQLDNTAVVPLNTDRRYIVGRGSGNTLNEITVQASQRAAVPAAMAQITRILDTRHHITDPRLRDFQIQSLGDRLQTFNQIVRILVLFIPAIAVILLVVGGIGVLNIMLASVNERTREVSINQANGATNRGTLKQVLIESIVLAGLGGLIGVGVGVGLIFVIQAVASPFDPSGALAGFTPVLSVPPVIAAFAVSLMIGLIAGSYPAYRAIRVPIQPLRYQ
jgi:putative ABC transport system permease protein